jgi:hypothetical protein
LLDDAEANGSRESPPLQQQQQQQVEQEPEPPVVLQYSLQQLMADVQLRLQQQQQQQQQVGRAAGSKLAAASLQVRTTPVCCVLDGALMRLACVCCGGVHLQACHQVAAAVNMLYLDTRLGLHSARQLAVVHSLLLSGTLSQLVAAGFLLRVAGVEICMC